MNSVNMIGRLTRDPDLRQSTGGKAVCTMRLAVNGSREGEVDYIDVVTFDKQAEACGQHLKKGREVAVSGRLSYSEWKADDGSTRSKHQVIGRVQFLGSGGGAASAPRAATTNGNGAEVVAEEEVPF